MEGTEGVAAEGGVGLTVLERGMLLASVALGLLSEDWGFECVAIVIDVPHWRGQVPVEGRGVKGVVAAGLVGRGSQDGRCFPCRRVAPFMLLTGT